MTTSHRATPHSWKLQEQWVDPTDLDREANADCLLELRDRLQAAKQRISELEGNSSAGLTGSNHLEPPDSSAPADEAKTLHTIALRMVDTLEQLNVLPEILDTLRRAIREPMEPLAPCPHIRSSDEGTSYCALAESVAAGSLVEVVGRTWSYGQPLHPAATRAAILACADWLERQDVGAGHAAARWLREEVERG